MAANSSISLTSLDFDTIKNTFKSYLRGQDRFKDYDFDGSNMAVLLDLLAYNTFHQGFYLNMVGNEMFMDSAVLRDSVVSHAKELNYVPRSFKSAEATINLTITAQNANTTSLTIPKGYTFSSNFFNQLYTFSVAENITINGFGIFNIPNLKIYEGIYLKDTYVYASNNKQRNIISNKNVDISSLSVTVIEDTGATIHTYTRASSLFNLDSSSKIYFVQGAENDSYEIVFGDGVTGRKPKENSVVVIEYRISNGELPNGCNSFIPDTLIDGQANIAVVTESPANAGSISESIESIKFNAPRYFTTQERAVTTEDYETLLKINFPEVNAVTAFGGEDLDPPQYGKVFIAVDLVDVDGLPDIKRTEYFRFLRPRSPVTIEPVFVNPEYTYLAVNSVVKYNVNITRLAQDDVKTIVSSAILNYARTNLNDFNRTFRYSQLLRVIDASQSSIISNETDIRLIKIVENPVLDQFLTFDVNYNIPLDIIYNEELQSHSIESSEFTYKGLRSIIRDNGNGIINVVSASDSAIIDPIGTINYTSGLLQFSNFKLDSFTGTGIKIYAYPQFKDISTINNVILNIIEEDVTVTAESVRA